MRWRCGSRRADLDAALQEVAGITLPPGVIGTEAQIGTAQEMIDRVLRRNARP
ncbi:hypothetical protein [Salipiger marinus]|nr:hypothetical protein [Salipiger marinus]